MLWWITQQLRMGNVKKRLAVVQKLARSDSADTVEALVFALNDREPAVRIAAAQALGKFLGQSPQLAGLLAQLMRDPLPEIRAQAATALGQSGDPAQVKSLVELQQDQDPAVRQAATLALEQLGQLSAQASAAAEPLIETMRYGSPAGQIEAVQALGRSKDSRAKEVLLEALQKNDPAVLIEVMSVLAQSGDESLLKPLERMLNNSNPNVRVAAVVAVAGCGGRQAVPALLRKLKDSFWEVRQSAVKALGQLADPETVDDITALLADTDRDVRESAIEALGDVGDRRAIPQLVLALIDAESRLRTAASLALRKIDRNWEKSPAIRQVLPKLKQALAHGEYWVQHSASQLFAKLKVDPETVAEDGSVAAAKPADAGPVHPAFPALADLLFDHDRDLRLAAVEAFRQLHERNAVPLLVTAAQDLDYNVQLAARHALAALE
jgi:HEAT repeat protein